MKAAHVWCRLWIAGWLLACSGCGHDSGGSPPDRVPPTSNPPPAAPTTGSGTLSITVRDAFGSPVAGARVVTSVEGYVLSVEQVTDGAGTVRFRSLNAGHFSTSIIGPGIYRFAHGDIARDQSLSLELVAHPLSAGWAGGVIRAWVPEGGVSADGRTLEFKLQLSDVPAATYVDSDWWDEDDDAWGDGSVWLVACEPLVSNDAAEVRPDCIAGSSGFDAPYRAAGSSDWALSLTRMPEPTPGYGGLGEPLAVPFRTILLVDQGEHVIEDDPGNDRLFAARYFLNYVDSAHFSAMLGAFATDRPGGTGPALVPQKPLSVFPEGGASFGHDRQGFFATLEELSTLEGGASPLFAAIDRAIDLQVAGGGDGNRSVVVITNGRDETCGSPSACAAVRDALIRKSRDTGVSIVTVGYGSETQPADTATLALLAQGAPGGAFFWTTEGDQLAPALRTVRKYLAYLKKTAVVTFRIESPVAGAFASGRTVLGSVRHVYACWDECYEAPIPFAVTIP